MMKINPTQLKSLRIQRRLSSKELSKVSKVSERQISRIESSDTEQDVRENTAKRLATALGVEMDTLADNEALDPAQVGGTEGNYQSIHPKHLKDLRMRKKLSRRKLAEISGISERQIGRVEASGTDVPVRLNTMMKLASALGVDAEMLVDNPTALDPLPVPPSQDVQLSTKISSQVRLAYDLVKHRYGPSQKDIINLAPLLFVLLAEGSLSWRRQWLEEAKAAMERLKQLTSERESLNPEELDLEWDESFEAEQESIKKNELLGDEILSGKGYWDSSGHMETPFLDYVTRLTKELNISVKVDSILGNDVKNMINEDFGPGIDLKEKRRDQFIQQHGEMPDDTNQFNSPHISWKLAERHTQNDNVLGDIFNNFDIDWCIINYLICPDALIEISGKSLEGLFALIRGDVRVPQIPSDLMTEKAKDKRVEWLESRMSDETQQLAARYRELFAKDYGCDFNGDTR